MRVLLHLKRGVTLALAAIAWAVMTAVRRGGYGDTARADADANADDTRHGLNG